MVQREYKCKILLICITELFTKTGGQNAIPCIFNLYFDYLLKFNFFNLLEILSIIYES